MLFREGVACTDRQDWACAVDRFGRAYELRPSPVIGSNYAIALAEAGRLVEASETFRRLLLDPGADAELRAEATRAIAEIEPQIGRLTIHAVGASSGVVVSLDGRDETSMLDVPLLSDPGEHVIEARRGTTLVASTTAHLEGAQQITVELAIPDPPVTVAPTLPPPSEELDAAALLQTDPDAAPEAHHEIYEEWWFWTIVGVAAVGAGVGIGVAATPGPVGPTGSLGTVMGGL